MRRIIGWIVLLVIGLLVFLLMTIWTVRDDSVMEYMASFGNLVVGIFVAGIVGWFIAPLLVTEEEV